MKYLLFLIILLTPSHLQSQSTDCFPDPVGKYIKALEAYDNGNNSEAMTLIGQIDENDSIYPSSARLKSSILMDEEKYEDVINTCNSFIERDGENISAFFLNKGVALIRSEKYNEAIATFMLGLENYPMNYLIYYNLGIAYEKMERYNEAIIAFQTSIILNPYYASPHLRLGLLCYGEDLVTQAVLCFDMYLLLEPTASNSLDVLITLNNLVSQKNESVPLNITLSEDDGAFEEIDLIVKNYVSLNDAYKIPNAIDAAVIKQNHAIMSKLNEFEGNKGFWSEKYVPFFRELYEAGYFNDFTYRIMRSTTNEKYKKIISKNLSGEGKFLGWAGDNWTKICGENNHLFSEGIGKVYYYRNNGILSSFGNYIAESNPDGHFVFFKENGNRSSEGYFKDGYRDKQWRWYWEDGSIQTEASYKGENRDNLYNGSYISFYSNGNIQEEANYKNGLYDGQVKKYTYYGALTENVTYSEGDANGLAINNYDLGEGFRKSNIKYLKNDYDSVATEYHPNGTISLQLAFNKGTNIGEEKHYFLNGELSYVYPYVNGTLEGKHLSLYKNGKTHQEGQYTGGLKSGTWKTYYRNGIISSEESYDSKGKLSGSYKVYDIDGRLHYELIYNEGDLIAYKYFDKKGNIIGEGTKKNQKLDLKGYHPNGTMSVTGIYMIEGKKEGEWKYYSINGPLESIERFENGNLQGLYEAYYANGQIKERIPQSANVKNGCYQSYYPDGTLETEGYYKDDLGQQIWKNYYPDGTLKEKRFLHNDMVNGMDYEYTAEGNLDVVSFFDGDNIQYKIVFDSTATAIDTVNYLVNGEKQTHFPNGELYSTIHFLNGYPHGRFTYYYYTGKIEMEGDYFYGERNGLWKWYNDKGSLTSERNYVAGNKQGKYINYHDSGTPSLICEYDDDETIGWYIKLSEQGDTIYKAYYFYDNKHGPVYNYAEEGDLQLIRYFFNNELIGYTYQGTDGNLKDTIFIKNGTGTISSYFRNGNKAIEVTYLNGKLHGPFRHYYPNGNLEESDFFDTDYQTGESIVFYPDGQIKTKCNYRNNQLHGIFLKYYPNGQLEYQMNYKNGCKTGTAIHYKENGGLLKKLIYYNDDLLHEEYFN